MNVESIPNEIKNLCPRFVEPETPIRAVPTQSGPRATDPRLADSPPSDGGDASHAHPMSRLDGCPECVINTELPKSTIPTDNGYRAAYLCSDCGHAWTTDWRD